MLSESMRQYFQEKYGRSTHFIPNGIEYGEPVPAQEITEKYGLHKNDYVLFLGRIVPEKGVHYLIEAFNKLNTNKKACHRWRRFRLQRVLPAYSADG